MMTHNYPEHPPVMIDTSPAGLSIDTIRALFTYGIITFVIIGGMVMLFVRAGQPDPSGLNTVLGGFIGAGLVFLTGQEVQTRTARQAASATAASTAATVATVAATSPAPVTNGHNIADDIAATAKHTEDIAKNTANGDV